MRALIRELLEGDWSLRKDDVQIVVDWLREVHDRLYVLSPEEYHDFLNRLTDAYGSVAAEVIDEEWPFHRLLRSRPGRWFVDHYEHIKRFVDGALGKVDHQESTDPLGDFLSGNEDEEDGVIRDNTGHYDVSYDYPDAIKRKFPYLYDKTIGAFPDRIINGSPVFDISLGHAHTVSSRSQKYHIYHAPMMGSGSEIELIDSDSGQVELYVDPSDPDGYDTIMKWAMERGFSRQAVEVTLESWIRNDELEQPPWWSISP